MLINAYGLFWRRDEVNWNPGRGKRYDFRLLGRCGKNVGKLRITDFRSQVGIYILYGDYGPYYVGLTRKQTFGKRLRDHLTDKHNKHWDRFSWFGFRDVLKARDKSGMHRLRKMATSKHIAPAKVIGDVEAILIKAMALENIADMKFARAEKWIQIKSHEVEHYLGKI